MAHVHISDDELAMRDRMFDAFRAKAGVRGSRHMIHASDFQAVLDSLGLVFGNDIVDRIMLLCKIDEMGMVDFSKFEEDVMTRRQRAVASSPDASAAGRGGRPGAAGRGLEFQRAVETSVGGSLGRKPPTTADPYLTSQGDRVRALSGKINRLFQDFDMGRTSLDVFREQLRDLGLQETPEARRLLHQTPVSFSALLKALTYDGAGPVKDEGAPAGQMARMRGGASAVVFTSDHTPMLGGKRHADAGRGGDVITWRDPAGAKGGKGKPVAGHINPWQSSTASDIMYGQTRDATVPAFTFGGKGAKSLPKESGVGVALWGGAEISATSRFETTAEAEARKGIGSSDRPVTSAGYNTKDGGFVREQIYGCIRQLDAGTLSTRAFRSRLEALGVPPLLSVDKLLTDYQANGRADFPRFVKAFEDYFAAATVAEDTAAVDRSFPGMAEAHEMYRPDLPSGKGRADSAPKASLDHGNIVSWSSARDLTEDEIKAQTRDGLRPGMKKRVDLYRGSQATNLVSWEGADEGPDIIGAGRPHRVGRKGKSIETAGRAERNAGNIIAWAGGDFRDASGGAQQHIGHIVDTHADGTPFVRGKGRPPSAAKHLHSRVPFGTQADLGRAAPAGGRPIHTSRSLMTSGNWMDHPEDAGTLPRRGMR